MTELPVWVRHDLAGAEGRGVRVAVVDSGRDSAWDDERILAGRGLVEEGLELVRGGDDVDRLGHGTACADLVLRLAPGVEIVPIRVFGERLETSPEVLLAALEHCVEVGAQIVNLSLGTQTEAAAEPLYKACRVLQNYGLVVVSALPRGRGPCYPAVFENVLGVEAADFADPFTYEYRPEQAAEIRARGGAEVRWLGGERRRVFGASFAAPHMTAIVARILERHGPLPLSQLRELLARWGSRPEGAEA